MPTWEYRVIELGDEVEDGAGRVAEYEQILNELGEEGWELVSVTETEYNRRVGPRRDGHPLRHHRRLPEAGEALALREGLTAMSTTEASGSSQEPCGQGYSSPCS